MSKKLPHELLNTLISGEIQAGYCKPARIDVSPVDVYMSLCLLSDMGDYWLSAKAYDLPDRAEAFYLDLDELSFAKQPSAMFSPDWPTVDIVKKWSGTPIERLFKEKREVRLYFDPEDRGRGLPPLGNLQGAAALEMRSLDSGTKARLLFYASIDYPCSLEISSDTQRCEAILSKLSYGAAEDQSIR